MENQDNFLDGNEFKGPSIISEETAELIFGNEITSKPEDITLIKEEKKKGSKKETIETIETPEEPQETFSADDLFAETETEDTHQEEVEVEDETEESAEDNIYSTLTSELITAGIFTEGEDDQPVTSASALAERWEKEKSAQIQSQLYGIIAEKHGQKGIDAFNSIFIYGAAPEEYLAKYAQVEYVKDLDISIEANQEKVYREYYRRQGLADDKIEKKLEKSKNYADLEDEAKDFQELLIAQEEEDLQDLQEQAKAQEVARRQHQQLYLNNINKVLTDKLKEKEFDGIPVTDKVARETRDYLYTEKYQLPSGERLTEFDKDIFELRLPENHEKKVKLALLLKHGLDLSKVKSTKTTKETNQLFEKLAVKDKLLKRTTKPQIEKDFFNTL